MRPQTRRTPLFRTLVAAGLVTAVALVGSAVPRTPAKVELAASSNPATPGNFTGHGFDQCLAPTQSSMDAWLKSSPFLAVGIYISGYSRYCRDQPNLTPTWISTQLRNGWKLLPITLGPQASCSDRYPRWGTDYTIKADPTNNYAAARKMGRDEAAKAVGVATNLGIVPGSTLFYDLEAWNYSSSTTALTNCWRSALRFTQAWTNELHARGYLSGFYSSAGSGIKLMDNARKAGVAALPDTLWIARWDGYANTSVDSQYLSPDAWQPHKRVKQYRGGHNETWGGVTINIDSNYLDVGRGSYAAPETHCGGVRISYADYVPLRRGTAHDQVQALKCLLTEQGYGTFTTSRWFGAGLERAVKAWQADHGFTADGLWSSRNWRAVHAVGTRPVLKLGSAGSAVRRLQRALNAGVPDLAVTGVFDAATNGVVRAYQRDRGMTVNGIVTWGVWDRLSTGR